MSVLALSMFNGLALGVLLFLVATGLSVTYGLMGVLNLAHGALVMMGVYLTFALVSQHISFGFALLAVSVAGCLLGMGMSGALKPLVRASELTQALFTLGVAFIVIDVIHAVFGTGFHSVRPPGFLDQSIDLFGASYPAYRLAVLVFGALVAAAVTIGFERSTFGAVLRAAVQDRDMVEISGINVRRMFTVAFVLGTGLAFLGGALAAPILSAGPGLDHQMLLMSLVIVVVGGLGSVRGALCGALLVGQVQTVGVAFADELAPYLLFATMGIFLVLKPSGLFGYASARTAH